MGYQSRTAITTKVELSEGYEAFVRKLRKEDADALQAIALGSRKQRQQITTDADGRARSEITQELDNASYTDELLVRGVAGWTLDDEDGKVLPITRETVRLLTDADSTELILAIKGVNTAPSEGERKNSVIAS